MIIYIYIYTYMNYIWTLLQFVCNKCVFGATGFCRVALVWHRGVGRSRPHEKCGCKLKQWSKRQSRGATEELEAEGKKQHLQTHSHNLSQSVTICRPLSQSVTMDMVNGHQFGRCQIWLAIRTLPTSVGC